VKGIATMRFPWSSEAGRSDAEKTLEVFLREAAEAGYDAVEHLCDGIEQALHSAGLRLSGGYVAMAAHEPWDGLAVDEKVLPVAEKTAQLGGDHLTVNCDPKGSWGNRLRKSEDELQRQGENLTRLADIAGALGLQLNMHNHANRLDLHLDDLRSVTEFAGETVGICLDTGWTLTSDDDPLDLLRRLGSRVRGLHLRNQTGERPTEWLGEGDLDMAAFIRTLKGDGYDGWLTTELWHREDVPRTMPLLEDQRRSVDWLRALWEAD